MQAKDVMTANVITVSPRTPVKEIASLLIGKRISAVPVVDGAGHVVGIVSEGDLMRRADTETEPHHSWWLRLVESPEQHAAEYARSHGQCAEDVMTREVVFVTEETPVGEIATTLEERRIKRVPVVRDGKLSGLVSRANLLRALATLPEPSRAAAAPADDEGLRDSVLDALRRDLPVNAEFIGATAMGGQVHLWGVVETADEKRAVRVAAENVPGVKSVVDHVGVLPPNVRQVFWAE